MRKIIFEKIVLLCSNGIKFVPDPISDLKAIRISGEKKLHINSKEEAKHVIDLLPKEATMDDIMYALYISTKFQRRA
jgi:hypothetical protein